MSETDAIKTLESKYGKSFTIESSHFQAETGKNIILAYPNDNPDLIFNVEQDPKTNHVNDYYPFAKWQYEAEFDFEDFLDDTEAKYAMMVGVSSNVKFDDKSIPSFSEILETNPETLSLNFFVHLFGSPTEEVIQPIVELDVKLRTKNIKKVGFTVKFYNESTFPDEMEEVDFGFNVLEDGNFEDLHQEDFLGLVKYRITPSNVGPINANQLLAFLIQEPNSMKFNFL